MALKFISCHKSTNQESSIKDTDKTKFETLPWLFGIYIFTPALTLAKTLSNYVSDNNTARLLALIPSLSIAMATPVLLLNDYTDLVQLESYRTC